MIDYFRLFRRLYNQKGNDREKGLNLPLKDRRSFLRASIFGSAALLLKPAFARGQGSAGASAELSPEKLPEGRLSFYNIHTDEKLTVTYREKSGDYDPEALKALNWILRCHYTNLVANIDIAVIEIVNLVDKLIGGSRMIHVISGFRSREYNQFLASEGHHVAKHSLHMLGKAIDIRIPDVDLSSIRKTALDLRLGGVGYYPESDFVHLDSGRFRFW